jgi:cytochrome b
MRSAKVLSFPLKCRACDDPFYVLPGYDYSQDRLCGVCAMLKQQVAEKRLKVPHVPIGAMAVMSMLLTAAAIVISAGIVTGAAYFGAKALQALGAR